MQKTLVAIFILSYSFSIDVFEEFNPEGVIKRGFVSHSSNNVFSYLTQKIDCQQLKDFGDFYKELNSEHVAFPKIGNSSKNKLNDKSISISPQTCVIYFENLLNLDQKLFWNNYSLVKSFTGFISDLVMKKYTDPFFISVDSFAYQPSTQRYVFIDIKRLYKPKKLDETSNDAEKIQKFESKMFESFIASILTSKIPFSNHEMKILQNRGVDTKQISLLSILNVERVMKNIVERLFETSNTATNFVDANSLSFESQDLEIIVTLGKEKRTFYLFDSNDTIIFYLCKTSEYIDKCINVDETFVNSKHNFYIDFALRYDVDIRESNYIQNSEPKVSYRVIEIFLIFKSIQLPGITSNNIVLSDHVMNKDHENSFIIFCQKESNEVTIGIANTFNQESQTFAIFDRPLKNKGNIRIRQVSPFILERKNKACNSPNTRIYQINGYKKQISIFIDENIPELMVISHTKTKNERQYLILKKCEDEFSSNQIWVSKSEYSLTYDMKTATFPSEVILKSDTENPIFNKYLCYRMPEADKLEYSLKADVQYLDNFSWNFNNDRGQSDESIVYLNRSGKKIDSGFNFSKFVWPKTDDFVVFISIRKEATSSDYDVQAVYFKEKNQLYEILDANDKRINIKSFPLTLTFNAPNSSKKKNLADDAIENFEAVYLSDNEIIYQLDISSFKECFPRFKVEDKTNLKIFCSNWGIVSDGKKINQSSVTRDGLKRIINQSRTKPVENTTTPKEDTQKPGTVKRSELIEKILLAQRKELEQMKFAI